MKKTENKYEIIIKTLAYKNGNRKNWNHKCINGVNVVRAIALALFPKPIKYVLLFFYVRFFVLVCFFFYFFCC